VNMVPPDRHGQTANACEHYDFRFIMFPCSIKALCPHRATSNPITPAKISAPLV
jgi:hypothetical protein